MMLMTPLLLWAQEASIKVSGKSQVAVGEQFRIAFEANAEGKNFTPPSFSGFSVVGGPFTSTSSSVQIVNGSMSRSVSNTYSYVLRADKEGTFTIGSATLVVDGNTVKSDPYQITVVAAEEGSSTQSQTGATSSANTARPCTTDP